MRYVLLAIYWNVLTVHQLSNLILLHGLLYFVEDLDIRLHHRSQMESAGLQRILALCREFGVPAIDKQLKTIQKSLDEDEQRLRDRLDKEILRDLNNPQDVYNAISNRVQDSKAKDYFLSMMQHLLLIREDGPPMVHYYQLLYSLVTDVFMDKKLAGAETRFGHSVERIIAQFNETDRYQNVEEEANKARAEALRYKLEKEALEEELSQAEGGLVGRLKERVSHLEQKLGVSRETTARMQSQMEAQKAGYEEQIAQLEYQIMELFKMLKEVGKGVDHIMDTGSMDRKTLVQTLEKHFQRHKTIDILEGRRRKKGGLGGVDGGEGDSDEDEDADATPRKAGALRRGSKIVKKSPNPGVKATGELEGRSSQFMDADDQYAEEQIQHQMAAGVAIVSHSLIYYFQGQG